MTTHFVVANLPTLHSGFGIPNATKAGAVFWLLAFSAGPARLHPGNSLIAQVEFPESRVSRVVALTVAVSQAAYAFAPAAFGLVREFVPNGVSMASSAAPSLFVAAAFAQGLAICVLLLGRNPLRTASRPAAQPPEPLRPPP